MRLQQRADFLCESLAFLLRESREKAGVSMNELSVRTGLAVSFIGYLERGMRKPSVETLAKIAWALEVDPSVILLKAERNADKATAREDEPAGRGD